MTETTRAGAGRRRTGTEGQQVLSGTLVDAEADEVPAPAPILAAVFGYRAGRDRFVG